MLVKCEIQLNVRWNIITCNTLIRCEQRMLSNPLKCVCVCVCVCVSKVKYTRKGRFLS